MTASQPPRLATWLLRRFVAGEQHEALIGDLLEEYRAGRSSLWYWRQVLIAILVNSYREIRAQKGLAVRALVTAFVLYNVLWIFVVQFALNIVQTAVFWLFAGPHGLPGWPPYFDDLHRVLLTLAGVTTGWSIAKLHQRHPAAMVLFCAVCMPFLELPLFIADSLHYQTSFGDVVAMTTFTMLGMIGIVIGGLMVKHGGAVWRDIV